ETEPGRYTLERSFDRSDHLVMIGRKIDDAAEMQARRRTQRVEPIGGHAEYVKDQSVVTQGRGMIFPGCRRSADRFCKSLPRIAFPALEKVSFRSCRFQPILRLWLVFAAVEHGNNSVGSALCFLAPPHKQADGRGIDERISRRTKLGGRQVGRASPLEQSVSLLARCLERAVLHQAPLETQRIGAVGNLCKPAGLEQFPRLFGITHSGKALNGAECCR